MRIGTWNVEGKWGRAQVEAVAGQHCDIWLLTEVASHAELDGYTIHPSPGEMVTGRRWAAVAIRDDVPASTRRSHPASAVVDISAFTVCSSVLPWRMSGGELPWRGASTAERTVNALEELVPTLAAGRTIWGGDWNHALDGPEHAGSLAGRAALLDALESLRLDAVTTALPHRLEGHRTIDHIAVPAGTGLTGPVEAVPMVSGGRHLSDHDAYVVEVDIRA